MAVPECNLDTHARDNKKKMNKMDKIKQKKAILAAQEINYAKALAGNDKKFRDKALRGLRHWLKNRSQAMRTFNLNPIL